MEGAMSAMSRKYQEEMLRLYGKRRVSETPQEDASSPTDGDDVRDEVPPAPTEAHEDAAETSSVPTEAEEDAGTVLPMEDTVTPPPPADDGDKDDVTPDSSDLGDTAFDYDPPALPETIAPFPPPTLPSAWAAQEAYEAANTAEGYLRVIASAADGAIPIPGATVRVTTRIGDAVYLRYLLVTDQNGEAPTVALAAPPAALSQDPENADPFAVCDIAVVAEGYHPASADAVPIFAGVTSRQVFQLVPYPLGTIPDQAPAHDAAGRAED